MTKEQRDSLFKTVSDLSEMNRILYNQAKKIENREGEYWKRFTNEEISKTLVPDPITWSFLVMVIRRWG